MTSSLSDRAAAVDLAAVSCRLYLGCREIHPGSCVECRRGNKRRRKCDCGTAGVHAGGECARQAVGSSAALSAAAHWN